jgi:hypothetical protein
MNQNCAIHRAEDIRLIKGQHGSGVQRAGAAQLFERDRFIFGLLRRQGKAKTEKAENARKCAFDHERILSQKAASASEYLSLNHQL